MRRKSGTVGLNDLGFLADVELLYLSMDSRPQTA